MASKPFNTSAKEPMSVKLRGLNASKSVTRQLEIDSRRMEERLRELKVAMNREKQERERQGSAGSGGIWSSAKTTPQGNDIIKKKSPTKPTKPGENKIRKIKVLKDTPLELPKRAPKKYPPAPNSVRKSFSGPPCGQCEERAVALTCMECGENYCAGCFAKFHLKGALRQHRSIPYQTGSNENSPQNSIEAISETKIKTKPSVPKTNSGADSHSNQQGRVVIAKTTPPKNPSPGPANSNFEGEYSEEESAASFAAALAEWRQAKKGGQQNGVGSQGTKKDVHDMGSGSTSTLDEDKKPVEISFHENPSMSYADRLLLKKHRRTELPAALSPTPSQLANNYLPRGVDSRIGDGDLTNGHYDRSEEELEMEEEHQRYANIFVKESPREEVERPKSNMTIVEVTDEDPKVEADLEVQSVYSVQEWDSVINAPSPHVMVVTPDNNNSEIKLSNHNIKSPHDVKSNTISTRVTDPKVVSSGKGTSGKGDQKNSQTSAKSTARKDLEKRNASRNGSEMASRGREGRDKQSAQARPSSKSGTARSAVGATSSQRDTSGQNNSGGEKSVQGRQPSTTGRQPSAGSGRNKGQEGRRSAVERPPSAGITTLPSKELQEIGRMRPGGQSQQSYQEGLGSFFMGGVDLKGKEEPSKQQIELERTNTPTNVLPACSYKGPSSWRPDSSMTNHPDQPATALSPSPPKQARDTKSSSMSGRKRSSGNTATGNASSTTPGNGDMSSSISRNRSSTGATPRAMSSKPRSGVTGRTPRTSAGKAGASDVDNTMHWRLSQAQKGKGSGTPRKTAAGDHSASSSASSMDPRSSSRIEVDGDDMTGYDEVEDVRRREEEDHDALEQLTWELASNEGRITADGRISSLSLIEGVDENLLLMAEEEQDLVLGITQDDGLGSGLSTPCNDLSLDQLSEEELQSDFLVAADNQLSKEEVQALDS